MVRILLIHSCMLGLATSLAAANPITVLDTLNGIDPATGFDDEGSTGIGLHSDIEIGPVIVLPQETRLTEIGAYVNVWAGGSRAPLPVVVRIHGSLENGSPDPDHVIASYEFPVDEDVSVISFQSIPIDLTLPAGTYYVLCRNQETDFDGSILSQATTPQPFVAGACQLGCLGALCGAWDVPVNAAFRILGEVGFVQTHHVSWGKLKTVIAAR